MAPSCSETGTITATNRELKCSAAVATSQSMQQQQQQPPSAADCYRSWTAYSSLKEAAATTNYRSVWKILSCECCPEPHCWQSLPLLPIPEHLQARIRWYDNVQLPYDDRTANKLTRQEIWKLQDHFLSHHQRIELVLLCLQPSLDRIYETVKPYVENIRDIPADLVDGILLKECRYVADGWYAVGQLIRGVAFMDRINYLAYVPRLAGVSGGNSPTMMPLTAQTGNLESLLKQLSTEQVAQAIYERTSPGRLAEAFIDCLDSLSRCWLEHVVTATTTIGLTQGTRGTPNTILVDRVLRRLHTSRLLQALGSLRSPMTGIGVEMHQLCDYQCYPLADHYLDIFCDPGPEFGTHNVGWLPKVYDRARTDFLQMRRNQRTNIWEHFYQTTRPEFCRALSGLLGVDSNAVGFGLGSSVTEVLSRLVASLPHQPAVAMTSGDGDGAKNTLSVLLTDDEFVTMQRAAAILGRGGAHVERVPAHELPDRVLRDNDETNEPNVTTAPPIRQLVLVSLINSCTQRVQPVDWVWKVPSDVVVVIDITQAVANLPLVPFGIGELARRPNVFLVGSLIKHARCGENLGFLTYAFCEGADDDNKRLLLEPASGWAAYCSGLRENKTAEIPSTSSEDGSGSTHRLYYDQHLEWDGGTPAWVEAAYVATRILTSMPATVQAQHDYVKQIQATFLDKASHLLSSHQLGNVSESNTLALLVSHVYTEQLPFGLDYKIVNGCTYLRIGFGIHNLEYHLIELVRFLDETGVLQ